MLVLSRKLGQSIIIGDDIVITVIEMSRGVIRLAISAPRDVTILREELLDTQREQDYRAKCDETARRQQGDESVVQRQINQVGDGQDN
jgi:carbon storage regulator